jgi:hypothetical protein
MPEKKKTDELHVRSYNMSTGTYEGVRKRTGEEDIGCYLEPMRPGVPLQEGEEILSVTPGRPGVLRLQSMYKHKGPARVASPAYRDNWNQIFGRTKRDKKNDMVLN